MTQIKDVDQLVILGNGFDLASGIHTTYENFIDFVLEENKIDIEQITDSIDRINVNQVSNSNIFRLNSWYLLLAHSKMSKDPTWKEVEGQILKWINNYKLSIDFNSDVTRFKLRGIETINSHSATISALIFIKMYSVSQLNKSLNEFLFFELLKLEKDFERFLNKRAGYNYQNIMYFDNSRSILNNILDFDEYNLGYNIMSFNYTDPWNSRWDNGYDGYQNVRNPENISMIHGLALGANDEVNRIIFGVDNEGINAGSLEYKFTKVYRTLFMNSDTNIQRKYKPEKVFNSSLKAIKFYGHSLGEADYGYFQQMFDYLDLYNNNELILYFFYSNWKGSGKKDEDLLQEQIFAVSRLIEKYGNTMNNKYHGSNLLTRLIQNKRIIIQKIDTDV